MKRDITRTLVYVTALCVCAAAQSQSHQQAEITPQHITFKTEDGALIYADVYGKSDRGVVLAHGGQFTKESWRPQAQSLFKNGYCVLAFDFRGFGKSHGPGDSDMFSAPMQLDVLGAVRYFRSTARER
jgi:dipeptidyl aminopeptidase/acylaminoacyl peptidase